MSNKEALTELLRTAWKFRNHPTLGRMARDDIHYAVAGLHDLKHRVHKHQCGHTDALEVRFTGLTAADGCGFIWEHDRVDITSDEQNQREHHCPRCGAGPWYLMYRDIPSKRA